MLSPDVTQRVEQDKEEDIEHQSNCSEAGHMADDEESPNVSREIVQVEKANVELPSTSSEVCTGGTQDLSDSSQVVGHQKEEDSQLLSNNSELHKADDEVSPKKLALSNFLVTP